MGQEYIPVLSYAFIGITSLVLAYATFIDKAADIESNDESATSMLPDVFSKTPNDNTITEPSNNNLEQKEETAISSTENLEIKPPTDVLEQKNAVGGRTKRHKKKSRNTKRKNNTK
jgi:hypothetical protein